MSRIIEEWISDRSLASRINDAVEIMFRRKGNYNSCMKRAMERIRVLRPSDFPKEFQEDWKFILTADQIALVELPPAPPVLSYGRIPPKFRDKWSKSLLRIYCAISYYQGKQS